MQIFLFLTAGLAILSYTNSTRIGQKADPYLWLLHVVPWFFDQFARMQDNPLVEQRIPLVEFFSAFPMQVEVWFLVLKAKLK